MIFLAPMAGITDGEFCLRYKNYFDAFVLGGYNLDKKTLEAAKLISNRRREFIIDLDKFNDYIRCEIKKVKKYGKVSVNVRFFNLEEAYDKLLTISKYADYLELNCHCRQREITSLGLGQELLKDKERLKYYLKNINFDIPIFLKIRLNYIPLNTLIRNLNYVRDYFDGLHIDCYYPNKPYPDINSLKIISEEFKDKEIIGNNSINSLERAKEMLKYSDHISVARAVLNNNISWIMKLRDYYGF
ncbi:TIM-barrel protein [Methanocaldococcus villosus KIN24-T80]|uniref:TIM-barrel protein n=1 Tax=Methanocaldococcus villosus KIN24-T80 TaxID=1069083 RepID=N6VZX2_9EURY|nr:MJ0144 family RNA dihydrouridine synthase-like protein [Methanocaldococcus villosus]ENN96637.1 TIM-barrel protein [Methanocaldococcus villosus KIN24-T80]